MHSILPSLACKQINVCVIENFSSSVISCFSNFSFDFDGHHSPVLPPVSPILFSLDFSSAVFNVIGAVSGHLTEKFSVSETHSSFCWSTQFWADRLLDAFCPHVFEQGDHSDHSTSKLLHFRIWDRCCFAFSQHSLSKICCFSYTTYFQLNLGNIVVGDSCPGKIHTLPFCYNLFVTQLTVSFEAVSQSCLNISASRSQLSTTWPFSPLRHFTF